MDETIKVVEGRRVTEVKKENGEPKGTDQRRDFQRSSNTHLQMFCQIESVLDKLIHPEFNWLHKLHFAFTTPSKWTSFVFEWRTFCSSSRRLKCEESAKPKIGSLSGVTCCYGSGTTQVL